MLIALVLSVFGFLWLPSNKDAILASKYSHLMQICYPEKEIYRLESPERTFDAVVTIAESKGLNKYETYQLYIVPKGMLFEDNRAQAFHYRCNFKSNSLVLPLLEWKTEQTLEIVRLASSNIIYFDPYYCCDPDYFFSPCSYGNPGHFFHPVSRSRFIKLNLITKSH
jgi:hypothetical protein